MAKVVLATGVEQLDGDIARELAMNNVEVAGECYYLEGILPCCIQKQADTVIISPELAGSANLAEVVIALRRSSLDIRVILLPGPGDLDETRELARSVIGAGVYDIVFSTTSSSGSKVNPKEVARLVLDPATYAEAEVLLTPGVKQFPGNFLGVHDSGQGHSSTKSTAVDSLSEREEEMAWEARDGSDEEESLDWENGQERSVEIPEEDNNNTTKEWKTLDESVTEDSYGNQELEDLENEPKVRQKQNTIRWPVFPVRKTEPTNRELCYLPHMMVAVWSPDGWAKSYTAFNLAAMASAKGFDTALVNYDLSCPELDAWFGVKQTGIGGFSEKSAGVLTFGADFRPDLAARLLKKRAWGIKYLPAGNKLGNIGSTGITAEALEQTLRLVYHRSTGGRPAITVVDAGRSYESMPTLAALSQADLVLIPADGTPGLTEVIRQQLEELHRLGHSPRFIEVLFTTPGRKAVHVCQERCTVAFDWMAYLIDRAAMRPQCLRIDGRRAWEGVLSQLVPSGAGNIFRRF
jgi:cellulose biosynthesis protein BcsQ